MPIVPPPPVTLADIVVAVVGRRRCCRNRSSRLRRRNSVPTGKNRATPPDSRPMKTRCQSPSRGEPSVLRRSATSACIRHCRPPDWCCSAAVGAGKVRRPMTAKVVDGYQPSRHLRLMKKKRRARHRHQLERCC